MKVKIILMTVVTAWMPGAVWATPPESLDVSYDQEKKVILVSGRHPTQDRLEHYIRRFRVTFGEKEPQTTYLTRQNSASEFQAAIPVVAKPGDTIRVEVFCNQGGSKESVLQIANKPTLKDGEAEDHAKQLKDLKDKDHQTLPIIP
ncbi:MAG: hypothetical protein JNN05_08020 [Candidatus Omnitrophica bacterium]|nr:hypothetical protein [Candidatus Omnitrophota bacterium]